MKHFLFACFLLPTTAFAQDREGNDTPGEWVVDHHKAFGLWDSMCDHRITGEVREQRCYIRYVDVFSRPPQFAAQFLFITPEPKVDFGMEAGTLFAQDGFRIVTDGAVTWAKPQAGCMVGLSCLYEGDQAANLIAQMRQGDSFAFDFTDRHGNTQSLTWDLASFAQAHDDFVEQWQARDLLAD